MQPAGAQNCSATARDLVRLFELLQIARLFSAAGGDGGGSARGTDLIALKERLQLFFIKFSSGRALINGTKNSVIAGAKCRLACTTRTVLEPNNIIEQLYQKTEHSRMNGFFAHRETHDFNPKSDANREIFSQRLTVRSCTNHLDNDINYKRGVNWYFTPDSGIMSNRKSPYALIYI
ncbi:hypothetical protein TcasGA2_TC003646 [Tribolium castaneum]|uniref:Uncharacterized protein n=1 Tax=Tribolium castaneum TaxID=7070 RepID=D6WIP8_TRICA|nr:hypothetical protein TcasGA2_TC003646 [Tribolium castaneum]